MPKSGDILGLSKEQLDKYKRDGILVLENVIPLDQCDRLQTACRKLVDDMNLDEHTPTVFTTDDKPKNRNEYFLNSGDKIRFFFEDGVLDDSNKLKVEKHLALNKVGHALHWKEPEFRALTFSARVKAIAKSLGFHTPAVVQSMYIFKQPGHGGEVSVHKDCTFLATEPHSCVGLWFALEEVTLENGCLWYNPGSQNTPTKRRFVRTEDSENGAILDYTTPTDPFDPASFIAAPCPRGSLVIIHGQVDHKSERNTSNKSRHAYTFHLIEQNKTKWSPRNWLQPTTEMPFTTLYDNQ